METEKISVRQFRQNFPELKERLEDGHSFTLMYRATPLADIITRSSPRKSLNVSREERIRQNIAKVKKLAGGIHFKRRLTPERISKLLDKRYEEMLH